MNGFIWKEMKILNELVKKILERLEKERRILLENNMHQAIALNFAKGIVQEVAEEYNGGWIPCSERLPSGLDFVLYTHKDGEVDICSIEYFYDYLDKFTAWQPLPEPFKERDSD